MQHKVLFPACGSTSIPNELGLVLAIARKTLRTHQVFVYSVFVLRLLRTTELDTHLLLRMDGANLWVPELRPLPSNALLTLCLTLPRESVLIPKERRRGGKKA